MMKDPMHPGEVIRGELEELGIPVADAAEALNITRQHLYLLIAGKRSITEDMALRLEKAGWSTAETWLRMQMNYNLAHAREPEIKRKLA